jgi:hypothetical protein
VCGAIFWGKYDGAHSSSEAVSGSYGQHSVRRGVSHLQRLRCHAELFHERAQQRPAGGAVQQRTGERSVRLRHGRAVPRQQLPRLELLGVSRVLPSCQLLAGVVAGGDDHRAGAGRRLLRLRQQAAHVIRVVGRPRRAIKHAQQPVLRIVVVGQGGFTPFTGALSHPLLIAKRLNQRLHLFFALVICLFYRKLLSNEIEGVLMDH